MWMSHNERFKKSKAPCVSFVVRRAVSDGGHFANRAKGQSHQHQWEWLWGDTLSQYLWRAQHPSICYFRTKPCARPWVRCLKTLLFCGTLSTATGVTVTEDVWATVIRSGQNKSVWNLWTTLHCCFNCILCQHLWCIVSILFLIQEHC